jgi:hypothetical protein
MTTSQMRLDDLIDLVTTQHPDGDALARLTDAVAMSDRLGELADHLVGHFVDQARKGGATWTEIGTSMGVSKQAAQKRYVPSAGDTKGQLDAGPFGRFTPRARAAIEATQEESRAAGNDYVGTEHLVLGLLSQPQGLAARALAEQGITGEQIRAAMTVVVGPRRETVPEHIPFSRRARKALELTVREALRLDHDYVGTEHLLLGVLADEESVGARVLVGLGFDKDAAERWIRTLIERMVGPESPPADGTA